ncbi:B-type cyclin [Lodderomyces elongisporus]|uniref:B-type cyclin n=1 Tax=Lodderomyces elongisporus TaxID=36914 RepID=UPI002924EE4C|nr:B-type cyclin [Lodderomyces elongisporus]WLF81409.1 B-type cyclin [Lodderomyces elongisporus]
MRSYKAITDENLISRQSRGKHASQAATKSATMTAATGATTLSAPSASSNHPQHNQAIAKAKSRLSTGSHHQREALTDVTAQENSKSAMHYQPQLHSHQTSHQTSHQHRHHPHHSSSNSIGSNHSNSGMTTATINQSKIQVYKQQAAQSIHQNKRQRVHKTNTHGYDEITDTDGNDEEDEEEEEEEKEKVGEDIDNDRGDAGSSEVEERRVKQQFKGSRYDDEYGYRKRANYYQEKEEEKEEEKVDEEEDKENKFGDYLNTSDLPTHDQEGDATLLRSIEVEQETEKEQERDEIEPVDYSRMINDEPLDEHEEVDVAEEELKHQQRVRSENKHVPMKPIYTPSSHAELRRIVAKYSRDTLDPEDEDTYDATMVAEYAPEIFNYMRKLEQKYMPDPYYMENMQSELKWEMRAVLIDWVVQVHDKFNLLPETLYLTVNYIDRFLSKRKVSLSRLQLVGAVAFFIAAKYEEINCPTVQEVAFMADNAYTVDEFLKAERFMIDVLEFDMGWPGPMSFLRRTSKADDYDYETRTLAKYFLELTIMDSRFVASPPSWLAAGAHYLSRHLLNRGHWTEQHVFYSGYTERQVRPLAEQMLENCRFPEKNHKAIFEKYQERRYRRSSLFVQDFFDAFE